MYALYYTSDLFFSSRVEGAAKRCGAKLETIGRSERMRARLAEIEACDLLLLDLTHADDPLALVAAAKERFPQCRVAAYGPHVNEESLRAAQAAGCDFVLTRNQFNSGMDSLFRA